MALRKNNQKDYDKFNDTSVDVLGNKREQDPPSKVTGENTGKIGKDKQGKNFALVLEVSQKYEISSYFRPRNILTILRYFQLF